MSRPTRRAARRDERGTTSIEIIGVIPIAMAIMGAIIQLYLIGYAAVSAESAARMAAHERANDVPPVLAAMHARQNVPDVFYAHISWTPGADEPGVVSASYGADTVTAKVRVDVPFLGIGVPGLDMSVERYAVMPRVE